MKLSRHFTLKEMTKSHTAIRLDIRNEPEEAEIERGIAVAENILEPIRTHFGNIAYTPNSWFRCEALEKEICHKSYLRWCDKKLVLPSEVSWRTYYSHKQHPLGGTVDLEMPLNGVSNDYLFEWIRDNLQYDKLYREFARAGDPKSGWVHVSYDEDHNRMISGSIG